MPQADFSPRVRKTDRPRPRRAGLRLSDDALLADLRRAAAKVTGTPSVEALDRHTKVSPFTILKRFGGWRHAMEMAGLGARLRPNFRNLSWQECFANMDLLWRYYGRAPKQVECEVWPSTVRAVTYVHRFGTWHIALRAYEAYRRGDRAAWPMPPLDKPGTDEAKPHRKHRGIRNHAPMARAADARRLAEGRQVAVTRAIGDVLRFQVMRRDKFKCVKCGANPAANPKIVLHVDHKLPFSLGGRSVMENLQTLCARCNRGKGTDIEK